MARRCELTGKAVLAGNNRSHAMNKSRRRYLPNIQSASLWSDTLQQSFKLRLSTSALRTVDRRGGLDAYLISTGDAVLSRDAARLKRRVEKAQAAA